MQTWLENRMSIRPNKVTVKRIRKHVHMVALLVAFYPSRVRKKTITLMLSVAIPNSR